MKVYPKGHRTMATCGICGKLFRTYPSYTKRGVKHCSWDCKREALKLKHRTKIKQAVCPICHKTFETLIRRPATYCSNRCAAIGRTRIVERVCKGCGRVFSGPLRLLRKRVYCSQECYFKNGLTRRKGERLPRTRRTGKLTRKR